MAASSDQNLALVQSSARNGSQNPSFAQQGSLDWVALSRMQYSASIAVLGRLAGAGIDSLTVGFGQAMCTAIPLTLHGEKVLHNAMSRLKVCSSYGDLIWFGVGVRHVLRDLVQTTQGSALVALSATLCEGYSVDVSALVLHELSQSLGAPSDITPSFQQWNAVAKAAACVFTTSTLGLKISQFTRLSGLDLTQDKFREPSHPSDLAQAILAVGKVINGQYNTVHLVGGPACSWVAAWADYVLGLRVQLLSNQNELIFSNYDDVHLMPQVTINFTSASSSGRGDVQCTGHTIVVRSGAQFIDGYLGRLSESRPEFSGGRLRKDSMLQDCFGEDFLVMMGASKNEASAGQHVFTSRVPATNVLDSGESEQARTCLTQLLCVNACYVVKHTPIGRRFTDERHYLLSSLDFLPELHRLRPYLLDAIRGMTAPTLDYKALDSLLHSWADTLCKSCCCNKCFLDSNRMEYHPPRISRTSCFLEIAYTVLRLLYYSSGLILESDLCPTYSGLTSIYRRNAQSKRFQTMDWSDIISDRGGNFGNVLKEYVALFCSSSTKLQAKYDSSAYFCAWSNGQCYSYLEVLREPTDSLEHALVVHVGAGTIQHGSRFYNAVSREAPFGDFQTYMARKVTETQDVSILERDTTWPGLKLEGVVAERIDRLGFWYRISSEQGAITFPPVELLNVLVRARSYLLTDDPQHTIPQDQMLDFPGTSSAFAEGEGAWDVGKLGGNYALLFRPLRNNTLGRCAALILAHYRPPRVRPRMFLVKDDKELAIFKRFWGARRRKIKGPDGTRETWMLIS